ncbi:PAS domain S-box protein [Rhodoferax sp. PAMC 29310]|uniref:PAS domain S-box protein n=1 Tax=Rhodoferax sp. PAMC 29310 TaxID=2822760 RepID=UPI001B31A233|nr:PAS domain S-box protein [Rhodoferax sp. PAMC 29310]
MTVKAALQNKLLTIFAAAALMVAVLTTAIWKIERDEITSAIRVAYTQEVIEGLIQIRSDTIQIELNGQSYRTSGDAAELLERDATFSKREKQLDRIQELTTDNPGQQERLTQLRAVVAQRLAIALRSSLLVQTEGLEAANAYIVTSPMRATRTRLRQLLAEMEEQERGFLETRTFLQQRLRKNLTTLTAISGLVLTALLFFAFLLIRRQIQAVKVTSQSLEQSNVRIQSILDTAADGIITVDARGNFETFNPAAERIFGYSAKDVVGYNMKKLMPEPYYSKYAGALGREHETAEARVVGSRREVIGLRGDGSTFPMELSIRPMQLDGESHYIAVVRDITASKTAGEQIAKSMKELSDFKAALDQHAIVSTTDANGTITYVNEKFCVLSKFTREELIGQNHRIINSGHHSEAFFNDFWQTIRNGGVWNGEIKNRAKDDTYYWVAVTIIPFLDDHGNIVQYIAIRADITERKRVELAVIAARDTADMANLAKDSFLATMSHEIRTPLGGLIGMLELLGLTPLSDDQRETVQYAMDSGQSLLRIVNDVLDWSKIEAGKLELSPQPVSIAQVVSGVLRTYAGVASAKSLVLEQHVDARLSPAHIVDPMRLSQVLNNFVSNAIKFTPKGRIEVRAELLERKNGSERVRFSVVDTGIGITKEVQQLLFQNYSQGSVDTARMYGGTGLGLSICRRLAVMMDGEIDLVSAPDQGSTFGITLNLPVTATAPEPLPMASSVRITPSHSSYAAVAAKADAPFVLVVDDHRVNRRLMATQLGLIGLRAETAENGEAGLEKWRENRFSLIITDCHMPKMDGYTLAKAIRKLEADDARAHTPIIAWTANALAGELELCPKAGMDDFLTKPTSLVELEMMLQKWLPNRVPGTELIALGKSTTPPTTKKGPVDVSELAALIGDDPELLHEFLADFQASASAIAIELHAAFAAANTSHAGDLAHKLKSSARAVGALALGELCTELESAAKAGDGPALDVLQVRFAAEMEAVEFALKSLMTHMEAQE